FGGVASARARAGVRHTQSNWTRQAVLSALRDLGREHGTVTRRKVGGDYTRRALDCSAPSSPLERKRVEGPARERRWSRDAVRAALRRMHRELGKVSAKDMTGGLAAAC